MSFFIKHSKLFCTLSRLYIMCMAIMCMGDDVRVCVCVHVHTNIRDTIKHSSVEVSFNKTHPILFPKSLTL